MGSPHVSTGPPLAGLDDRDRAYVAGLEDDEERATVVSTLLRYRQPDRLRAEDRVPSLSLIELESGRPSVGRLRVHRRGVLLRRLADAGEPRGGHFDRTAHDVG